MHKRALVTLVGIAVFAALPADAQNNRTAVSVTGSDSSPCTVAAPCRSFAAALAATNPGGEIVALSSGGYGPFTIDRSVSVIANGVHAAITAPSGNAITLNAAGAVVVLRGLALSSLGATIGVYAANFSALSIFDCSVSGFVNGVLLHNNSSNFNAFITNTRIHQSSNFGFYAFAGAMNGSVVVHRCELIANGRGVTTTGGVTATVSDSLIASSTISGVWAYAGTTTIESCRIVNGATGVLAGTANGLVRLSNTLVTGNTTGLDVDTTSGTGFFETRGNNTVRGNTNEVTAVASLNTTSVSAW